ncbi:LPS biosynthesis protein [Oribacterium sp. C9]|uniref:N-acetyl sugar amidotransferase n=1 Tax=Oribacterium sp. C9 TaxID=1943579 RepID=UPI0009902A06|nr:N-acetyl sugar amidotransferase [Oribacterium sp. C9]OON86190.1 LPS biosynthesis protein [Oribacterium sp. C9]
MKYCRKCLQPDTRPGIMFSADNVCYACLWEESKKNINWKLREEELKEIAEAAKRESHSRGGNYDCVIGVSGGKDSTFQAVYAKEKLGLKPLLVNCVPDEITEVGQHNIDNLNSISGGFDIIAIRPNPRIAKVLSRKCFFERGNIISASEYCLWASAYIIALKFEIPLIIQGENNALTLGTASKQDEGSDAYNIVHTNTVRNFDIEELINGTGIPSEDMYLYKMPSHEELDKKGIRAIWLQYYVKEWSQVYNADFAVARGLKGRMSEDLHDIGRYRRFTGLDSDLQIVNQMIKYYKYGFGMATDEACYDIREGRLSRDDAIWYVNEYDGKCGEQYIEKACKYMDITQDEFYQVLDKYVNKKLFKKNNGKWERLFEIGKDFIE